MQSTVGKRSQQKPGKLANVGYTLNELFGAKRKKKENCNNLLKTLCMLWLYGHNELRTLLPLLHGRGWMVEPWQVANHSLVITMVTFTDFHGSYLSQTHF